jgi:hypothetical protein
MDAACRGVRVQRKQRAIAAARRQLLTRWRRLNAAADAADAMLAVIAR